jgi:pyruvate dehydrogenase complex dehydrogenase (E1) component
MRNTAPQDAAELEALETREWLESLDYVLQSGGPARVGRLLKELADHARRRGVKLPFTANTPYINTIPASEQPPFPGSREIERRIKSLVRWNALAMVVKANKQEEGIGGHISTYASAATLYEVGFNHFFKGKGDAHDGDIIYFQGHAAPGIYARAFLEGTDGRGEARKLPARAEAGRRPIVLSAPVADAGLLGIPHGVDGAGADLGDLSGAFHALPRGSRAQEAVELESLGVCRRR